MYNPSEDSFLLSGCLENYLKNKDKKIKILDMGSGTGIQAETCINLGFRNVLATDIDKEAVNFIASKIPTIQSDLFSNLNNKKFDLIVFNPPYLPKNKHDKQVDTSGGKFGDETIVNFLKQAKNHLNKNSEILLLLSSLTPKTRISKIIKQNYKSTKITEKTIFFEKLEVWLLSPIS